MAVISHISLDSPELDFFRSLTDHELRQSLDARFGICLVESETAVRAALDAGVVPVALLVPKKRLSALADIVDTLPCDTPVYALDQAEVETITGYRVTRGVICACERPAPRSIESVLDGTQRVCILEDLTDTENVGAIIRNAAGLGVDAVVLAPTCPDPLSRRAIRVSVGNVFRIPWCREEGEWPAPVFDALSQRDFTTAALALRDDAISLHDPVLKCASKLALFLGAEGSGLAADTIARCDHVIRINMAKGVDSLNVAATSAIAFFELFHRG